MHGQQNDKYTEMHGRQNDKYTEMHGQQNVKKNSLDSPKTLLSSLSENKFQWQNLVITTTKLQVLYWQTRFKIDLLVGPVT